MGIRGPQPQLKLRSEPLADIAPPDWLGDEAKSFWRKHAGQLKQNQLLTSQTADAFALLSDLWERVQMFRGQGTTRAFLDTSKAFTSLAKNFRLLPTEKPNVKEDRFADFGEVDV